ncbi:TatD family hydrolase [Metabacillus sp. GX 13764]|uniref:TatD family hydrolase n=1 Tax=Metabacillus kandeliae TaxID=2900151 RepID=UPI001E2A4452|nr:TatD family hydrolase [Metabacillus kandeliae]MCD7034905.1 TatD family hydrolase [Metabacillus kandeliae]
MIDAHIHLDQYNGPMDQMIERWREAGVTGVLAVSSDLASSYQTLELQSVYPDFVHAALGHHPEKLLPSRQDFHELLNLIEAEKNRIKAIGEIGLPYYEKTSLLGKEKEEAYIEHLEIFLQKAKETGLPAVLHAVHSEAEKALSLAIKHSLEKVHFHWLKAPVPIVQSIISSGYMISVTPEVCYRERDQQLARIVPQKQLMIETDGPWPYSGPFEDRETAPEFLEEICECLSNMLAIPLEKMKEQTASATADFFRLR